MLNIDFSQIQVPGAAGPSSQQPRPVVPSTQQRVPPVQGVENDPAHLRDMFLADPHQLSLLKERNRPLADALLSGDLGKTNIIHPLGNSMVTHVILLKFCVHS